jgi:hypothetical protein
MFVLLCVCVCLCWYGCVRACVSVGVSVWLQTYTPPPGEREAEVVGGGGADTGARSGTGKEQGSKRTWQW